MTETKTKKFLDVVVLLLVIVGIMSLGILWLLSKKLVAYGYSVSALEMAQQQEFFEVKLLLGIVIGVSVGWTDIWMTFRHKGIRSKVDFRTGFVVCILVFITLIPFELATWGYRDANHFVSLRKWLPFNIAFGTSWFSGAGLMVLSRFRGLFARNVYG